MFFDKWRVKLFMDYSIYKYKIKNLMKGLFKAGTQVLRYLDEK